MKRGSRISVYAALASCAALLLGTLGDLSVTVAAPGQPHATAAKKKKKKRKRCKGPERRRQCDLAFWTSFLGGSSLSRSLGGSGGSNDPHFDLRLDLCRNETYVQTTNGRQSPYPNWTETETGIWHLFGARGPAGSINIRATGFSSVYADGSPGPGQLNPAAAAGYAMTLTMTPAGLWADSGVLWVRTPGPC